MGTDVNFAVEMVSGTRRQHGVEVEAWRYDRERSESLNEQAGGRNHVVYRVLGLAGPSDQVPLHATPRGLPEDIASETRDPDYTSTEYAGGNGGMVDCWGCGWAYLGELREYDWTRAITLDAVIPLREIDQRGLTPMFHGQPARGETYEEIARSAVARRPTAFGPDSMHRLTLDLRGDLGDLQDQEMWSGHYLEDLEERRRTHRRQDEREAALYLADPSRMPPPTEMPRSLLPQYQASWRPSPRVCWARVAWREPIGVSCRALIGWIESQHDVDDLTMRVIWGFS